ncbi:MAG: caspase family protein [Pseudomonadota bacterium]
MALIIGNDSYEDVPTLDKAAADARAVSDQLSSLGFETFQGINLNRRDMNRRISEFTSRLEPGDTAFVFFAGHGVEIDGENYLLPTDIVAPSSGESDFVKAESIALSDLLDRVRATGAKTSIAIIDACRNNPFEITTGRSIGRTRGLGRITAPQGTFVIFSAGAGQLALDELREDDSAKNSVFTRALLPRLAEPGLELRALMADLRVEVRDLAGTVQHTQIPAYYDELLGEFYFTPAAAPATTDLRVLQDDMRADFDLARSIGTVAAVDQFLERYADRSDEYSYQIALQLRDGLTDPGTDNAADTSRSGQAATESVELAAAPLPEPVTESQVLRSNRDIIRQTQQALNEAGCSAGGADGVIGPRTRAAFGRYLRDSGSKLTAADLGNSRALDEMQSTSGTVCTSVVTAAPAAPVPAAANARGLGLSGSWKYKATCALVVKVTGNVRFASAGGNKFSGNLSDSLGQRASSEVYLNDDVLTGTDYFPGVTVKWRGKMAADGQSYTATGSTGCAVYAWRVG